MRTMIKISDQAISPDTVVFSNQCCYCGAELPKDLEFQNYHMAKEHNLIV